MYLWRPKRAREFGRASKLNSKLVALEREIAAIADRVRGSTNLRQNVVSTRSAGVGFFKKFLIIGRKLITIAIHPVSMPRDQKPQAATPPGMRMAPNVRPVGRVSAYGVLFISVCFGLLSICGIMIAVLYLQIRDMKVESAKIKQNLSAAESRISQIEKSFQQSIAKERRITGAQQRHIALSLSNDDKKVIRAFIKVLPSNRGARQKMHVGDEISDVTAVPVPQSIVSQISKLRGAKFLIDQNGAIVIIGPGSNRVDAVVEPQK